MKTMWMVALGLAVSGLSVAHADEDAQKRPEAQADEDAQKRPETQAAEGAQKRPETQAAEDAQKRPEAQAAEDAQKRPETPAAEDAQNNNAWEAQHNVQVSLEVPSQLGARGAVALHVKNGWFVGAGLGALFSAVGSSFDANVFNSIFFDAYIRVQSSEYFFAEGGFSYRSFHTTDEANCDANPDACANMFAVYAQLSAGYRYAFIGVRLDLGDAGGELGSGVLVTPTLSLVLPL